MKFVVTAEARAFRRAVGVTAWAVLEELVLDATVDEHGSLVARTNVRAVAAELDVSKDTAASAITRLTGVGVVRSVVAERGARGALPSSSYVIDLDDVAGVGLENARAISNAASRPSRCNAHSHEFCASHQRRAVLAVRPSRERVMTPHISPSANPFKAVTHWHPAVPGCPVAVPATLPTAVRLS